MPGGSKNEIHKKTVVQIKGEGLGRSDKPDWCNKKVKSGNSRWLCDRCYQEFEECSYRYLLQVQIQDHTGLTWVTAFQESEEEILGCSAKELYLIKYEELKIKEEIYGDEQRVKMTVVKADKANYSVESRLMLDLIPKFHSH
ncbi:unnamed protein product [Fraxinus pennsylvanica]|uniref:Replication factor A C-terminal domain-containing protein n=1 Tax=Fraxinus pennsylvanica TaxID=56036 RepID=A0AAD2E5S1_9LAMI|nr:unnamed protein product [Fraxinus pennsylvanica]